MSSVDVKEGIGPTSKSVKTDIKTAIVAALDLQSKTGEVGQTSKDTEVLGTVTRGKRRKAQNCSDTRQKKVKNGRLSESSNHDDTPQVSETNEAQLSSVSKTAKKSKLEPSVSKRSKRKKTQPKKRTPVKEKNGLDYAAVDEENIIDAADEENIINEENMIDAADEENITNEENVINAADEENMIDAADEENIINEENLSENESNVDGTENGNKEKKISQKPSRRKNTRKVKHLLDGTEAVDDDCEDDGDDDDDNDIESDCIQNADTNKEKTFRCLEKYVIKDKSTTRLSITCGCCSEFFVSLTKLKAHLQKKFKLAAKNVKLDRVFQCNQEGCFKQFSCTSNCKIHMISMHLPERKFTCEFCAFSFKRRSSLLQHLKALHTDDGAELKFKCEVCDKQFRRKIGLEMHSSIHTDDKKYICSHENCGRQFRLQTTLYKHEKCVHSGEKPYECETCGERFTRKTYLRSHMYKHTGVKSYICDVCYKSFTQKGNLMQHKKSLHGKRKSYQCPQCGQAFNFKSNLTKHLIKHDHHGDAEMLTNYSDYDIDAFDEEKEDAENAERIVKDQPTQATPITNKGDSSSEKNVNENIYLTLNKHDKNQTVNPIKIIKKKIIVQKPVEPCVRATEQSRNSENFTTCAGDVQIFVVERSTGGSCGSTTRPVFVPCRVPVATIQHEAVPLSVVEHENIIKEEEPLKANRDLVDVDKDMCVNDGPCVKEEVSVTYVTAQSDTTQSGGHISVVTDLAEVPDKTISQLDNMDVKVETNQHKEPESVYVTDASVMNALEVILGSGEQQLIPASIISKPSTLLSEPYTVSSAFNNENIIQGAMQLPVIMDIVPQSVTDMD